MNLENCGRCGKTTYDREYCYSCVPDECEPREIISRVRCMNGTNGCMKRYFTTDEEADAYFGRTEYMKPNYDPKARMLSDMITTKQLGTIRALAREAGVDHNEFSMEMFECETTELSRRAASDAIKLLRNKVDAPVLSAYPNELEEYKEVLRNLVEAVEQANEDMRGIFSYAFAHGVFYNGKHYGNELAAARNLLEAKK